MHFHYQNLNEDRHGNIKGSILREGRCFLNWGEGRGQFMASWAIPSRHVGVSFGLTDESEVEFHIGVGLVSLWFSFRPSKFWSRKEEREFNLYFHDGSMWLMLWGDPMASSRSDPWYKHMRCFNPIRMLFGGKKHSKKSIKKEDIVVPMPEGCYTGKAELHIDTWKRPRLPWRSDVVTRVTIDMDQSIPKMGKGENSYDCGEDGTWGLTCQANSIEEAIGKMVGNSLEDRRKYGVPERIKPVMVGTYRVDPEA